METEIFTISLFILCGFLVLMFLIQLTRFIYLHKDYNEHRANYARLTSDRKQRLEAIRNPKPYVRQTRRRPGRPTDAERKRRAEAARRAAELKQSDNT